MTKPLASASGTIRSPALNRETSLRSAELLRSSVLAVVTARPMPELSFSSETCIATMPMSPKAMTPIHTRPRTRRSIARLPETSSATQATRSAIATPP